MFKAKVRRRTHMDVADIATRLRGPTRVKVGFPEGTDGDIVDRAFFNEFGTKGSGKGFKTERGGGFGGPVPERPFMRNAIRENRHGLQSVVGKQANQILRGETSLNSALSRLGIYFQGKIQDSITSLDSPPNAPLTIELKGSSQPLVDTGEMRQSVTWKVDDE